MHRFRVINIHRESEIISRHFPLEKINIPLKILEFHMRTLGEIRLDAMIISYADEEECT